jgi:aminomethyltransferase
MFSYEPSFRSGGIPMDNDGRKTPLFEEHQRLNAKIVPFGGWMMPVSYEGVLAEHKAVREQCGIFDVSHMGEVWIKGPQAAAFCQWMLINDVNKLVDGGGQYTAMLNPEGGFVDDLILYRLGPEEFLACVNASNTDKDFAWFAKHAPKFNVRVTNESAKWSQLAVQGPTSTDIVCDLLTAPEQATLRELKFTGIMRVKLFGQDALIARTGYTGERGYEIYLPNAVAAKTWQSLIDTLRLEAGYLLYGNDMNDTVTPLEAGIQWAVRMDCGDFQGRNVLERQKAEGLKRKLFAFKMQDSAIPRHDMDVYADGKKIGHVTSGSSLPTVGGAGGMALLDCRVVKEGSRIEVDVRGKRKAAVVDKRPLYTARVK